MSLAISIVAADDRSTSQPRQIAEGTRSIHPSVASSTLDNVLGKHQGLAQTHNCPLTDRETTICSLFCRSPVWREAGSVVLHTLWGIVSYSVGINRCGKRKKFLEMARHWGTGTCSWTVAFNALPRRLTMLRCSAAHTHYPLPLNCHVAFATPYNLMLLG